MFEFDLEPRYKFGPRCSAGLFFGYNYDLGGTLKYNGQNTVNKTDWSGFRTGVTISYSLKK
jgi:hypothetical protein